jgi:hypothetical protein
MPMKIICSALAIAMMAVASTPACACQYQRSEPFAEVMAHAAHIGIVQIVSSQVRDGQANDFVLAQVQRVETLRGKSYPIRTLAYNNGLCGGLRLDVGHYFLLMTDGDTPDVALGPVSEVVLDLTRFDYLPPEAWARVHAARNEIPEMVALRKAISGSGKIPQRYVDAELQSTKMIVNPSLLMH